MPLPRQPRELSCRQRQLRAAPCRAWPASMPLLSPVPPFLDDRRERLCLVEREARRGLQGRLPTPASHRLHKLAKRVAVLKEKRRQFVGAFHGGGQGGNSIDHRLSGLHLLVAFNCGGQGGNSVDHRLSGPCLGVALSGDRGMINEWRELAKVRKLSAPSNN